MAKGYNRVALLGHIGTDPELKYIPGGQALLTFRMATTHEWMTDGEKKSATEWHNISMWGKRAEGLSKVLVKGAQVLVEGSIKSNQYVHKDGSKRTNYGIVISDLMFAGSKPRSADGGHEPAGGYGGGGPSTTTGGGPPGGGDDIPF